LSPDEAYDCLQNYAFTQWFCVVVTSHDKANTYIRSRILDLNGFSTLLGKITSYVVNLMVSEWTAACIPRPNSVWQGSCLDVYTFPLRYGLPCRHWMLKSVLKGFFLPLSLVHSRWWLSESPVLQGGWTMGYYNAALNPQECWIGGYRNRSQDIIIALV
jgi:hypothetical protein